MPDVNIDKLAKHLILDLCKWKQEGKLNLDYSQFHARKWVAMTRLMFLNYPAILVIEKVYRICEEVAENQWKNFKLPDFTKKNTNVSFDPTATELKDKVPIIAVAQKYGLKVKHKKAICPFHEDKNPSLTFYPETNSFYCFGCNNGGDLIKFVQLMEDLKNENY